MHRIGLRLVRTNIGPFPSASEFRSSGDCPGTLNPIGITVTYCMRFKFDRAKSREVKRRHGVRLYEAQKIFDQVYIVDQKSDDPEQFRAIGWCACRLCSVIFEMRTDSEGEFCHLITAWKCTDQEEQSYAENA